MKITGFNQILISDVLHNLSKLRAQIIEQECDRVGDTYVDYGGIIFHANVRQALSTHLSQLRFEVVNDYTIKLGEAIINVSDLMYRNYCAYGKVFIGTIEEIKEQVTKYLEGLDSSLPPGIGIWLGDNYVISKPNESFSDTRARLIANEIRKVEEALK